MAYTYDKNTLLYIKEHSQEISDLIDTPDPEEWDHLFRQGGRTSGAEIVYFINSQLGLSWKEIFKMLGYAAARLQADTYMEEKRIPFDEDMVWPEGAYKAVPSSFFQNSTVLETFTSHSEDLYAVDGSAFNDCKALRRVELDSCIVIGNGAFYSCPNLSEVILPEGLEIIADNAFIGCPKLDVLEIPISVTSLGKNIVSGDTKLRIRGLNPKEAKRHITDSVWVASGFKSVYKNLLV